MRTELISILRYKYCQIEHVQVSKIRRTHKTKTSHIMWFRSHYVGVFKAHKWKGAKRSSSFCAAGSLLFSEVLLFMATYQPVIKMLSSVCFHTCICHWRTHPHALFVVPSLLIVSTVQCVERTMDLIQQSRQKSTGTLMRFNGNRGRISLCVAIICRCIQVWWKSVRGFQQGVDFLGSQTGTFMGDTGESNNTSMKVHINQISLHEVYLNVIFNPNTPAAIY